MRVASDQRFVVLRGIAEKSLNRLLVLVILKSSYRTCSIGKGALKNFAHFTEIHLCWSLFLIKLQDWGHATLFEIDSNTGFFHWNFRNFEEDLWTTASVSLCNFFYIEWKRYSEQGEKIQTLSNIYNEVFMRKQLTVSSPLLFSQKRVIIDISHGSKYISGLLK